MKYYVYENNSGGRTVLPNGIRYVEIEADSIDTAIEKFEEHFKLEWEYENSFEGNSCNCCGRRFELYIPPDSSGSTKYRFSNPCDWGPWFSDNEDLYKIQAP